MEKGQSNQNKYLAPFGFLDGNNMIERFFSKGFAWRDEVLLYLLAGVIGLLTALAALGFNYLIDRVDRFAYGRREFEGEFQIHYLLLPLIPAAGALLVGLIGRYYSREAVGHGVPEVMYAIVRRDCKIRLHVALARMVTAALTIGSGGSAGPEGPIIQIGAAIASSAGRFFRLMRHHLPVLIACGAAAGIAAIFRAPIAGVLFAMEVFLRDVNFKTLSPILIAAVISSMVVSTVKGAGQAIFPLQDLTLYTFHWSELGNYILLGLLCAAAGVSFIWLLNLTENAFERMRLPQAAKPLIGGLVLGIVGLVTMVVFHGAARGEPVIFGKGYAFIGLCIGTARAERFADFELTMGIVFVLMAAKMIGTALTLGSGGSGGVFAPSLFMGATLGYGFGLTMQRWGWFADINPATYSLVGMAAMLAATTHAPMGAIVMLFEITHNYSIILPVMFSCTVALLIARLFCHSSIETLQLRHHGIRFGLHAKTALLRRSTVRDIMQPGAVVVQGAMPLQEIIANTADEDATDFIVVDRQGRYQGLLCDKDMRNTLLHPEAIPLLIGEELARKDVPVVSTDETLDTILDHFSRLEVNTLPVTDDSDSQQYVGMVSRADLMRRYMDELQKGE